jgi:hypothetical protein
MRTRLTAKVRTVAAANVALLLIGSLCATGCSRRGMGPKSSAGRAEDHYRRCETTTDNLSPLLVEWPSTQRSALEAQLKRSESLIAVRYTGCEMEILRDCRIEGSYRWTKVAPKHDELEILNTADVWMKIPLGAAKLISAVERYGALRLDMQLVGQWAGPAAPPSPEELQGDECRAATHVVGSLMVGAFEITSRSGGSFEAGAEFQGAGAGASASRHEGFYSSDGKPETCRKGYEYDPYAYGQADHCESLLQIELLPIAPIVSKDSLRCPDGMSFIDVGDEGFCLDTHEVTVHEYAECAKDHTCSEAPSTADWPGIVDEEHELYDDLCNQDRSNRRNHPVNCVTWDQAASYCSAQGKRLPEVYEWHLAAQGGDQNRTYPWGEDEPSHQHVNACGKECKKEFADRETAYAKSDGFVGTAPVGSFPVGTARWDLVDMAGNVWEWTGSPGEMGIVVVGGSATSGQTEQLSSVSLDSEAPSARRFDVGFRCAVTATPEKSSKRRSRR